MITVGELFAGIGGIGLGLERTGGFETKWQVEIDDYATRVLEKHWPNVKRHRDVRTFPPMRQTCVGPAWYRHDRESWYVDLICGGFPCTDISNAGKRAGIRGAQSGLFYEILRVARILRPKMLLLENVAALLHRGMGTVLGELSQIGYDAEWHCIPAASVGAPHIRDRVFIIGVRRDANAGRCKRFNGSQSEISKQDADAARTSEDVADTIGTRLEKRQGERRDDGEKRKTTERSCSTLSDTLRAILESGAGGRGIRQGDTDLGDPIRDGRHEGTGQETPPTERRRPGLNDGRWWSTEPDVGRTLDGFRSWLDRSGLTSESHKRILAYVTSTQENSHADATKKRAQEVLRTLRDSIDPEELQWAARGLISVPAAAVLFAYLCQLETDSTDEARVFMEGSEALGDGMRSVQPADELDSTPRRSGHKQQRRQKHSDALQTLSRLLALDSEKAWIRYRRENAAATSHWESGIARVAHAVPARVDRLRCLGNAVVPQVAELIGRAILAATSDSRSQHPA